ncbi:membrane protein insertase YidC [Legionella dresdenensis]|uniref:Membrane protein insertase YidC n=1 Tax=Legionella dresdenensis TaxID=450200 RepID=A0ABV8CDJ6_9GAMM
MDTRRVILYAAFALIVYTLWTKWQIDYPTQPVPASSTQAPVTNGNSLLPDMSGGQASSEQQATIVKSDTPASEKSQQIRVKTDVMNLAIDLKQGDIVNMLLPAYPVSADEPEKPIQLLYDQNGKRYVANSSIFTSSGNNIETMDFNFTSAREEYKLESGQKELVVTLNGKTDNGLAAQKTFIFTPGSYLIKVNYQLENQSDKAWLGYFNTQLLRSMPEEDKSSMFHVGTYTGASYSNPGKHRYQKVSFKDMTKNNLNADAQGGWVAMQQHYFVTAWVPAQSSKNILYTRNSGDDYTIGTVSQSLTIAPGENKTIGAELYTGPEITSDLKAIAPGLDMTVDYGFLWFLSSALFSLMKAIHSFLGNWGWSIVVVTMLIKLAFYRLSATSYKSMAGMRKLQPKLQALRERHGDDKAKLSQATMELYRQEKVNPLGGCLPILVQIPVFIALYWVLLESVELRQAPFIFWIKDLAAADPYHILPIIMGGTMLIQQRLNPAPPDPVQAKVMMFLPVLFTALFWSFPAGLVLYWIVNNTLSILQQWYITRKYSEEKPQHKKLIPAK